MVNELITPSIRRRMACWLYEGMLVFGVVFVAGCLFFGAGNLLGRSSVTQSDMASSFAFKAYLFVVIGIYFVWLWAKGQTLAMKTWGITVLDLAGKPISQSRALLRYVLSWLWFLPALALISVFKFSANETIIIIAGWIAVWAVLSRFHSTNQFWHDALAGTRLVFIPNVNR